MYDISFIEKKNDLANLKNEVEQFHPLLQSLLPKLPRVIHIEYTHGPNENGADFVISRTDDTLYDTEYIGVIVKTGKIHQDLSSIKEQIDECDEKKILFNGKKDVSLDEIWIVTNEHITNGAKVKINRLFSKRKIKFIQNTDLIKLIDKHLSSFWFDIPIDIGEYLSQVLNQIMALDRSFTLITIQNQNIYIDQELIEIDWDLDFKSKISKKLPEKIDIFEILKKHSQIYIQGRAGYGKSKLIRQTIENLCNPVTYLKYGYIPLYLSYREYVDIYEEDIQTAISKLIPQDVINKVGENNELVIFIDGFDEKSYSSDLEFNKLKTLVEDAKNIKYSKFVITSRPLAYIDPKEMRDLKLNSFEIEPLTIKKIKLFFDKICKEVKISDRIWEDIKKSHLFKQLPRSPIAAILLANLLSERSKELPSNLTELYQKYSELMLGRWDISKGIQSEKEYEAAKSIIKSLSIYFVENDLEYIALDEAKSYFENYLNKRNLGLNSENLFTKISNRSGIIQAEFSTNRVYFKHRTFAEFFYAMQKIDTYDPNFINERVYDFYWRNIYFFYIGLKKDCEEILTLIINIPPSNFIQRFTRIINMADYFLAGYATPYDFISKKFKTIIIETTKLYFDIIKRRVKTGFQLLPEMNILYFFQALIRNCYSYDFFSRAIEEAVLEILTNTSIVEDEKYYAAFFISVISIDIERDNPFDGLIEASKEPLPLPIQLAIHYEQKSLKKHSTILKKQERKLHKKIKHRNMQLQKYIENLHNLPLKKDND